MSLFSISRLFLFFFSIVACNNSITAMSQDQSERYKLRDQLIQQSIANVLTARALQVVAELGVADHMKSGVGQTAESIAQEVNVHPQVLYRMMRLLVSYGIFEEDNSQQFALTSLGQLLCSDVDGSIRDYLIGTGDKEWWNAIRDLDSSAQTSTSSFEHLHGKSYWDYLAENPSASERFAKGMKNYSDKEDEIVPRLYDFSRFKKVVDVGGGRGGFITSVLNLYPSVQEGILFDMPQVVQEVSLVPRLKIEAGDFFKEVPTGADAYILKRVLLDWDEEKALLILKTIVKSMPKGGTLLVIDSVVHADNKRDLVKDFDLLMLVLFAGKHRSDNDFERLFNKSGLTLIGFTKTPFGSVIIEGVKN